MKTSNEEQEIDEYANEYGKEETLMFLCIESSQKYHPLIMYEYKIFSNLIRYNTSDQTSRFAKERDH
jgi:hypothetical protein